MNEGRTFFDLPQAQTVPAGSRYAVEMGDGTGTKSVTHEDVVKAVGANLPLGDVNNLETNVKTDYVSAINEIKRKADASSGGATIQVTTSDPGLYGRTVTVTDGANAVTGVMSYGGECVITGILLTGDLTVSASTAEGAEDETTVNVSLYATYYTDLDTRQGYNHLNISTNDAGLIGRVVMVSNGTDTVTAIISQDGRARLVFTFSGMVTVTASDAAGNTANASISIISGVTTYDVYLQIGNMVSDAFSITKAYVIGDYAIHENVLYKFTAAKAAGAWDASKVQAVTVANELCELNGKMNNKVSYTQSGQVILKKDFVLDKDAYLNTPFVLESVSGSPFCPGISFHNPGKEGAALYLQGGSLILLKHTGEYYRIQMEFVGKQE